MTLVQHLAGKKKAMVKAWVRVALEAFPQESIGFLKSDKGRFQNPVGYTVNRELEALFDDLVAGGPGEKAVEFLDNIVAHRAIQDFIPSHALAFVFEFKAIVRRELADVLKDEQMRRELEEIDRAVDHLAMLAFDVYAGRRQRIYEIRCNELRRSHHMLLRRAGMIDEESSADPSP
jgi:hypothetical protein